MARLVLFVVMMLLMAAPADARIRQPRMTFALATAAGFDYWTKQHKTIPCHPTRRLLTNREADALDAAFGAWVSMVTYPGTCEVQITPGAETYRTDPDLAWLYCTDVVHELGHMAGLEHAYGGVMANPPTVVPWACAHPARFRRVRSYSRDGASRGWPRTGAWRTGER